MACATAVAGAHVVSQLFAEWKPAETWRMEVLFDAGYAVPEWRGDANAEAPRREWLVGLKEAEWRRLREEAERYLRESMEVRSGGRVAGWQVTFPDFSSDPPDFPVLLNDGAYFRVTVVGDERLEPVAQLAWRGGSRPSFVVDLGTGAERYLSLAPGEAAGLPVPVAGGAVASGGHFAWVEAFRQGYLHVLPLGLDHVLFVLGLFFYQRRWRPLLSQSLAFTAAHTVTLGLAAAGVVRVPGNWVEPAIALSLVAVALENLWGTPGRRPARRLGLVFGFGLVHGLGFAGALSVWLKPGDGFLGSLLCANLGVEAAQATLLAGAWGATAGWNRHAAYQRVRALGCWAIAGAGLWWALERSGVLR